eukprot:m.222066 g.222066  ORF g.222066 m.222066 type:complete len:50 (-) comp17016_c0_seq3:5850-5999(-)
MNIPQTKASASRIVYYAFQDAPLLACRFVQVGDVLCVVVDPWLVTLLIR